MSDDGDQTPLLRRSPHNELTDNTVSELTPFLAYVALVVNLVPISAGLVLGYSSPAIVALETDPEIQLTPNQASLFGSIPCLTAAIGSIVGSLINSKLGRKPAMLATSPIYTVGWILLAFAGRNVGLLILGRAFGGLAMGMCFVVAPGYIAEMYEVRKWIDKFLLILVLFILVLFILVLCISLD